MQKNRWDKFVDMVPILTVVLSIIYIGNFALGLFIPNSIVVVDAYSLIEELFGTIYFAGIIIIFYLSEIFLRGYRLNPASLISSKFKNKILLPLLGITWGMLFLSRFLPQRHNSYTETSSYWSVLGLMAAIFISFVYAFMAQIYSYLRLTIFRKFESTIN